MDTDLLRTKRSRDGPGSTGASDTDKRNRAKRACRDRVTDDESRSSDEEDTKSEPSGESESFTDDEDSQSESFTDDEDTESECSTDDEDRAHFD